MITVQDKLNVILWSVTKVFLQFDH